MQLLFPRRKRLRLRKPRGKVPNDRQQTLAEWVQELEADEARDAWERALKKQ